MIRSKLAVLAVMFAVPMCAGGVAQAETTVSNNAFPATSSVWSNTPLAVTQTEQPLPNGASGVSSILSVDPDPLGAVIEGPVAASARGAHANVATTPTAPASIYGEACGIAIEKLQLSAQGNGNNAYTLAENHCDNSVASQQICVHLREFWISDSTWHIMTPEGCSGVKPGNETIQATSQIKCKSSAVRAWESDATGQATNTQGFSDTGSTHYDTNLSCVA